MDTNKNQRENDRDQELQRDERNQKLQSQDRDQPKKSQDHGNNLHAKNSEEDALGGTYGEAKQSQTNDQSFPKSQNPENLQDEDHRMDRRTNDGEVDANINRENNGSDSDLNKDIENQWHRIESDYRRRYPNVTDDDVNYSSGEFDTMSERLAKRTNKNRDQVHDEIRNWNQSK